MARQRAHPSLTLPMTAQRAVHADSVRVERPTGEDIETNKVIPSKDSVGRGSYGPFSHLALSGTGTTRGMPSMAQTGMGHSC